MTRAAGLILAALLLITGTVFFFQGLGVLPGSPMTGQYIWAVIGGLEVVVGAVLLYFNLREPEE